MHPPTPKRTPSPSHEDDDSSSAHQHKRQRTDDGSSASLPRNRSPAPLTPPRSLQTSPVPDSPAPLKSGANFDCLPQEIKQKIILNFVDSILPHLSRIGDYRWVGPDPRVLNGNLRQLLNRRRILTLYSTVSRFWYTCLQHLLLQGPRVVVSAGELSKWAGNEHQIPGKVVLRSACNHESNYNAWQLECRPRDAWQPQREKIKRFAAAEVTEIICWMTSLPWRNDNSEALQRWPRWYLLDCMRYDLEDMKVKKLAVIAGHQATLADTLNSTIPNSSRITHLHFEVHHPACLVRPSDDKFENIYRHCPDSRHLCPRLFMHRDTLESLTLRNVAVCASLEPSAFPKLKNLRLFWVNNWPGLCRDHYNDPMTPYYSNSARFEVDAFRWEMAKLLYIKPQARVLACVAYDILAQNGEWISEHRLLVDSSSSTYQEQQESTYWDWLTAGSLLSIPVDDEEDFSEYEHDWVDDEEEEEEVPEEQENGTVRATPRVVAGSERKIAPAPPRIVTPAYRPMKIR
ncbi:hypothetical protein FN846DRAFT_885901 [Sphaerosporella brunnea]|uniref:Uncharacterized protein n=1 Tax=Sphaerosporella brunnea TaxID=1250544 RepID=A0A5J5FAA4_9PEZI|nr:hypothetical protein FN846DRAFT_885901 [Sphaerosporella brunnea]